MIRWLRARFSFQGRASRREYWLQTLIAIAACFGGWLAAFALFVSAALMHALADQNGGQSAGPFELAALVIVSLGIFALYLWALSAAAARRHHDLDKPFRFRTFDGLGIQCWFYRGTIGPNQYGPDPLEKTALPE